ncbi:MAG: hypothetical protein ACOYEV_08590 [Candidatus Nanopelagicales bacterium]
MTIMLVAIAPMLSACGASGPTDIKCEEFLALGASQQEEVVAQWWADQPGRSGEVSDIDRMMGSAKRQDLASYCQSNPDDKIKNLVLTF